jgi:putative ABC transport system permease protein
MAAWADLVFRAALVFYPKRFRQRFGESMLETLEDRFGDRRRKGLAAALVFVVRASANLAATGLCERIDERRSSSQSQRRKSGMGTWLGVCLKEARFALRSLRKRPSFTLTAVVTLALGVGANTAIFSVVRAVLLDPLPYEEPGKLVNVVSRWPDLQSRLTSMSLPDLVDIEAGTASIDVLAGYNITNMTLTELGEPEVIEVARVTKGLLETFRAAPLIGRDLASFELGPEGPHVVVVGYGFWRSRLGGGGDVLGKTVTLDGVAHEIVGVAPREFRFPERAELFIPSRMKPEDCGRGCHSLAGVGRLADGGSVDSAQAELDRLAENLEAAYPDSNTNKRFTVRSLRDQIVGEARPGLILLLGAVGLLVLIACANVSSLLLVRASTRTGEVAIRTAIGASRTRLVAQALLESLLLAFAGGALGLAVAAGSLDLLLRLAPALPRIENVAIDVEVLLFTLATLLLVTVLVGTAPAFVLLRAPVRSGLANAGSPGPGRHRFRNLLLVFETALASLLLVGAGLLLKSFSALYAVEPGFDARNVSRFTVLLPEVRYDSLEKVRRFYRELEERVRVIPGVESAGSAWGPPLGRARATGEVLVTGRPEPEPGEEHAASILSIGPGYLETMRIAVVRGRGLVASDDFGSEPMALVNETFVRENFPSEEPIGREVSMTIDLGYGSPAWRIVGVVVDVRSLGLELEPSPEIFVPHGLYGPESMTVTVRSRSGAVILPGVRDILRDMDPAVAIHRIEIMTEVVEREIAPMRFHLALLAAFAGLAALLAAVGIYGVVAYAAASRTREIGLRLALGAERASISRLVLAQGLKPAALGLALGLIAAYLGGHLMQAVLFGVDPRDPSVFAGTSVLLLVAALAATLLPARRASRIDPVRAIKFE